eukprot:s2775_g2.t1
MDFYNSPCPDKPDKDKKIFKKIASRVQGEQHGFQNMLAEVAIPEPHHQELPGHGMLIEFCTSDDSTIGQVAAQHGVHVIRCTEKTLNCNDPKTEKALLGIIESKPGVDLLGSLPCGPWTQWQNMNIYRHGPAFRDRLERARNESRKLSTRFARLAREVARRGGRVLFEWPRYCSGWSLKELMALVRDLDMQIVDFDGCQAVRERAHLHWQPRVLHEKEAYFPPTEFIECPLAMAAHTAMLQMTDEEKEVKKAIYDRSFVGGVLPYDMCIDSFPVDTPPPPLRHAYITGQGDDVPECPPRSDGEDELQPTAVTRQLPRSEVLSREDAIAAIKKEFDGIGAMGTWDLESVQEEESVKRRAIEKGQTIHLADILAICSESMSN